MTRYQCKNCNFIFVPKVKDRVPSKCPYCASNDSVKPFKSTVKMLEDEGLI